jgi:hypothetical protein
VEVMQRGLNSMIQLLHEQKKVIFVIMHQLLMAFEIVHQIEN